MMSKACGGMMMDDTATRRSDTRRNATCTARGRRAPRPRVKRTGSQAPRLTSGSQRRRLTPTGGAGEPRRTIPSARVRWQEGSTLHVPARGLGTFTLEGGRRKAGIMRRPPSARQKVSPSSAANAQRRMRDAGVTIQDAACETQA